MAQQLLITDLDGSQKPYPFTGTRLSLGRAADNDLCYPDDAGLSRHHMVIEKVGSEWWVEDLNSKNGTFVNEERITQRVRLKSGDRVRVSRFTMMFQEEDPGSAGGTVIFDPTADHGEFPGAHSVTLRELIGAGRQETGVGAEPPSTQWTDTVKVLIRAGRELVAQKPPAELYDNILLLSLEAVGASRGVLLTAEDGDWCIRASRGDEFHISTAVRDRVMNDRRSLLIRDVRFDEELRERRSIVMQKVHSLMAVPLQTDENVLGLIYVDTPHAWRNFSPEDLNLLTVMANVAAMRIERERLTLAEQANRLMEAQMQQAAEIQRQFLPAKAPVVAGLDLVGYNRPCHAVGGDYYDYVCYPDGKVLVALGDVAGKGMAAALLMVNLQARFQLLAEHRVDHPSYLVTLLNRAMTRVCPDNRFITIFLGELDPATGELAYCNAGHNAPLLVRTGGEVEFLESGGPVLGILPDLQYEPQAARLEPGDTLLIYSDGITEAESPENEMFGEERLLEVVQQNRHCSAQDILHEVSQEVDSFVDGAEPADDVTLVVARRTTTSP